MNKTEIRVTIDDTPKQQRAIEILGRYNEPMSEKEDAFLITEGCKTLIYGNSWRCWWIGMDRPYFNRTEITLDQLEEILKNEKK